MTSDKSLGIVCCYFNPCNYQSKYENFVSFYNNLKKQVQDILVVELNSDTPLPDFANSINFG